VANVLSILTFAYVFVLEVSYSFTVQWIDKINLGAFRNSIDDLNERLDSVMVVLESNANTEFSVPIARGITKDIRSFQLRCWLLPLKGRKSGEKWDFIWLHLKSMRLRQSWSHHIHSIDHKLTQLELALSVNVCFEIAGAFADVRRAENGRNFQNRNNALNTRNDQGPARTQDVTQPVVNEPSALPGGLV
jgi:hypothetical protein